jgi:hypothetical protein
MIKAILAKLFINKMVANSRLGLEINFRMRSCWGFPFSEYASKSDSRCEKNAFSELEQMAEIAKHSSIPKNIALVNPSGISVAGLKIPNKVMGRELECKISYIM